jgi:hypothetical protein
MKNKSNIVSVVALTLACCIIAQQTVVAKQGATDPIPGTSKGATNSGGGGGGKSTTPAPTPTPTLPAISTGTIAFTAAGPINGSVPSCSGNFQIDPYYPTLLDMTVNINVSSLNVPDGTVLYINVVGTGGTLYPWTSNAIVVTGGSGVCSEHVFVTLGAGLAGVVVTDALGNPVFVSN